MIERRAVFLGGILCVLTAVATAHHNSSAQFQMDAEETVQGSVVRYEWVNPHVYLFLRLADGSEVEIEGGPVAFMRRLGWSKNTLAIGDVLEVVGNPGKRDDKHELLMVSAKRADVALPKTRGAAFLSLTENTNPTRVEDGLNGTWVTLLTMDTVWVDNPESLQLTKAGEIALGEWDEATMHPALECVPMSPPIMMVIADTKEIAADATSVRIKAEFNGTERVVWLDGRAPTRPTVHGHSLGRWEGDTLVIETSHFAEHRIGNSFGLPSSSEKRLTERLSPGEDGVSYTYEFELEDPVYLAAPHTGEVVLAYRPDLEFDGQPCDLANSRRFITHD